jgi:hypothetical protein
MQVLDFDQIGRCTPHAASFSVADFNTVLPARRRGISSGAQRRQSAARRA